MQVKIEKVDNLINLVEYTIRQESFVENSERIECAYFQARIEPPGLTANDSIHAAFSYYGDNGEFLGTDGIQFGLESS